MALIALLAGPIASGLAVADTVPSVAAGKVEATTIFSINWQVPAERPVLVMTGIFRDVIVRTAAGWRFARRTELVDQSDLPQ